MMQPGTNPFDTAAILGGVIGGLAGLAILGGATRYAIRDWRRRHPPLASQTEAAPRPPHGEPEAAALPLSSPPRIPSPPSPAAPPAPPSAAASSFRIESIQPRRPPPPPR